MLEKKRTSTRGCIKDIVQPKKHRNNLESLLDPFDKWEFLSKLPFDEYDSFCGNISSGGLDCSAPMLLARLVAAGAPVVTLGQEGYKITWEVILKHKATKNILYFYDYKGGTSVGSNYTGYKPIPGEALFLEEVSELISAVANPRFPHPYDGCVVGEIA